MENAILQRIKTIIDNEGLNINSFSNKINVPRTTIKSMFEKNTNPSFDQLSKIIDVFTSYSIEWIIRGKGDMLNQPSLQYQLSNEFVEGAIPYYDNLPVSAGQFDLATYRHEENPTGWIKIPGVSAKGLFPVVGCSMKPDINPGDVVGLSNIDRWEMVDPDKVYLIVTRDDRMIKHLMIDESDKEILWCISPNYPKFSIRKDEIVYIYRITFHGKLM